MSEQGQEKKPLKRVVPMAWHPVPYENEHVFAMQALRDGKATPDQQAVALKWILEFACGRLEQHYYPGEAGRRDTDFALGRAFVGHQIAKLLNLKPTTRRGA